MNLDNQYLQKEVALTKKREKKRNVPTYLVLIKRVSVITAHWNSRMETVEHLCMCFLTICMFDIDLFQFRKMFRMRKRNSLFLIRMRYIGDHTKPMITAPPPQRTVQSWLNDLQKKLRSQAWLWEPVRTSAPVSGGKASARTSGTQSRLSPSCIICKIIWIPIFQGWCDK